MGLSRVVRRLLQYLLKFRLVKAVCEELARISDAQFLSIIHNGITLKIHTPTELTRYRAQTFATKEPDTLEWIETFPEKSIFWDIGANIGLYSIYAAKLGRVTVFAFEPVPANLVTLYKNLDKNLISSQVTVVPIALSDLVGQEILKIPSHSLGISHVSFGVDYDFQGNALQNAISISTVGMSWSAVLESFSLKNPNYVKIDVDGIEHLILEGAGACLETIAEILVEVNLGFNDHQNRVHQALLNCGFSLRQESLSPFASESHAQIKNQIWRNSRI